MKKNRLKLKEVLLQFVKKLILNTMTIVVVVLAGGLAACSDSIDDDTYVRQKLTVVAIPDFIFTSSDIVLSSTTNTIVSRAEKEYVTTDDGERLLVQDNVSVKLYVAGDNDEFMTLRKWDDNDFRAVQLSVHMCTPTDVAVFLPVRAQHFTYNNQRSLDIMSRYYFSSIQTSDTISKLTSIYGEATMTCIVSSDTIVAKIGYGKIANGTEGVELTITGVTRNTLNYLQKSYNDGIKIEIWNYFKNTISRDELRDNFNKGATVYFSRKPVFYVNEFTRVRNCTETVYGILDEETGLMVPYKDKNGTELLDEKYWVRPAQSNGAPSKDFLILWHKNEWDCKVTCASANYPNVQENNADIPYDIETKYYKLPDNYNVYYYDEALL